MKCEKRNTLRFATTMIVYSCLDLNVIHLPFWVNNGRRKPLPPIVSLPLLHTLHSAFSIPAMAGQTTLLRALQRIVDAARKIKPGPRPTSTVRDTPIVFTSLPEHKPLLPLLLSNNIPAKLAKACSDRYDGYASKLKLETESKLTPYLAYRNESHPAKVYSLFLDHYNKTLRLWSQSILNTALTSLKRDSVELSNLEVTHLSPLWLPVRLPFGIIPELC